MRNHLSAQTIITPNPKKTLKLIAGYEAPTGGSGSISPPLAVMPAKPRFFLVRWIYKILGLLSLMLIVCSATAQSEATTIDTKGITDLFELANKLIPSSSEKATDPVRIQKAINIRVRTNKKKLKQIKRLNKEYKEGLPDYQYDALVAEILAIDVNDVRQLRVLSKGD